jgi:hypothetical protein
MSMRISRTSRKWLLFQPASSVEAAHGTSGLARFGSGRDEARNGGHRVQSGGSWNPRPLKIIGTHLSARAARVFTCFAAET